VQVLGRTVGPCAQATVARAGRGREYARSCDTLNLAVRTRQRGKRFRDGRDFPCVRARKCAVRHFPPGMIPAKASVDARKRLAGVAILVQSPAGRITTRRFPCRPGRKEHASLPRVRLWSRSRTSALQRVLPAGCAIPMQPKKRRAGRSGCDGRCYAARRAVFDSRPSCKPCTTGAAVAALNGPRIHAANRLGGKRFLAIA
jgi:hypothetical protein